MNFRNLNSSWHACVIVSIALVVLIVGACASGDPSSSIAGFEVEITDLHVQIIDGSSGARYWRYHWDDGSPASTAQEPSHDYDIAGAYTVRQRVCPSPDFAGARCADASGRVVVSDGASSTVQGVSVNAASSLLLPW